MAGKPKRGIDFSPWDVHILEDDTKIDELIEAQGWNGFGVYFYLCQKAYATEGYFYRWSYANAATTARRMGGGIRSETVKQAVSLCLRVGLFDKELFDRENVLTSKGIQRRYMTVIQKRSCKTVDHKYWLLNDEESKGFVVVQKNSDSLPEDAHFLPENDTKESKVKKSKVSSSTAAPALKEIVSYAESLTAPDQAKVIAEKFYSYYEKSGWETKNGTPVLDWQSKLRQWIQTEQEFKPQKRRKTSIPKSDNAQAYQSFIYNIDE